MAFLTIMSCTQILVHTCLEQGFRRCFADGLNLSIVLSVVQAHSHLNCPLEPEGINDFTFKGGISVQLVSLNR